MRQAKWNKSRTYVSLQVGRCKTEHYDMLFLHIPKMGPLD